MLCFYLILQTLNGRKTQLHADKVSDFVLSSHMDTIGDRNDVEYVGAFVLYAAVASLPSICMCPHPNTSPHPLSISRNSVHHWGESLRCTQGARSVACCQVVGNTTDLVWSISEYGSTKYLGSLFFSQCCNTTTHFQGVLCIKGGKAMCSNSLIT